MSHDAFSALTLPDVDALQTQLNEALLKAYAQRRRLLSVIAAKAHRGSLAVKNADGTRRAIEASLLPIVIDPANDAYIDACARASLLARFALVRGIAGDEDLRRFLTSGLDSIPIDIMTASANAAKLYWRSRLDTLSTVSGRARCQILECNGGEPQGEGSCFHGAEVFVENALQSVCGDGRSFRLYPDVQIQPVMDVMLAEYARFRGEQPSLPAQPHVGFFVFRARSSGSDSWFEAEEQRKLLEHHYGLSSTIFDPFDVERLEEVDVSGRHYWVPVVNSRKIHLIRRLAGEPFQNLHLWRDLQANRPRIYYPFTGVRHRKYNPEGSGCLFMLNGLSSFMTDKKLDVCIADPALRLRFGLRQKIAAVLEDPDLGIDSADSVERTMALLGDAHPWARMLRRPDAGLYDGDETKEGGLAEAAIRRVRDHRHDYVIKLDTLGDSSSDVFVGHSFPVENVPAEVFEGLLSLSGEDDVEDVRDMLWPRLVEYALSLGGALVQRRVEPTPPVTTSFLPELRPKSMGMDCDPQSVGLDVTRKIVRLADGDTYNVNAGGGRIGVMISTAKAEEILTRVSERG